jgi:hypothetical protein
MRDVPIVVDTLKFQSEMKRAGNAKAPLITATELAKLPDGVYILTGNNTKEYGGGQSGTGYVMQDGKAKYSFGVSPADVSRKRVRVG